MRVLCGTCSGRAEAQRRRSGIVLGATLVAALVLYFCAGHAAHLPMASGAMGKAMHGVGICLLVTAVLGSFVLARPTSQLMPRLFSSLLPIDAIRPRPVTVRARASPVWLQRFLN